MTSESKCRSKKESRLNNERCEYCYVSQSKNDANFPQYQQLLKDLQGNSFSK